MEDVPQFEETLPVRRFYAWRTGHPDAAAGSLPAWCEAWRQATWVAVKDNSELGLRMLDLAKRLQALEQHFEDLSR